MVNRSSFIESIRNDYTNGSSTIAKTALELFCKFIEATFHTELSSEIEAFANEIKSAKPAMAAVSNIIDYALAEFRKINERTQIKIIKNNLLDKIHQSTDDCCIKATN
ncbi:MAG: hypothetical protein HW421_2276 [Ignavibacteria bacterium]|nr:hypothetical protein [Ignavibacteria bacterium]